MPVQQHLRDLGVGRRRRLRAGRLDVDLLHIFAAPAQQVAPRGRDRHDDHVVLVVEAARRAFGGEDADDAEVLAVDLHHLADRISAAEEIGGHRWSDDRHLAGGVDLARGEELTARHLVIPHRGEVLRGAGQAAVPVLIAVRQLRPSAGAGDGRHHVRRRLPVRNRLDIVQRQARSGAEALLDATRASRVRWKDGQQVGPERLDLLLDGDRGAVADPNQQDDGRHADQDAEHGERGP